MNHSRLHREVKFGERESSETTYNDTFLFKSISFTLINLNYDKENCKCPRIVIIVLFNPKWRIYKLCKGLLDHESKNVLNGLSGLDYSTKIKQN